MRRLRSAVPIHIGRRTASVVALVATRSSRGGRLQDWIHATGRSLLTVAGMARRIVCTGHALLQHAIVVSHHSSKFGMKVEKSVVLAHRFAIRPCELRTKLADTFVQFL